MINQTELPPSVRSVAIIGSGLSGLSAAILLQQRGCDVTLFEKSRGPGGRLASKRVKGGSADIGAQYFTIRNPAFKQFLDEYAGPDAFQLWNGHFGYQLPSGEWEPFPQESRYVGVPRMTALSRALSSHVSLMAETRIQSFSRDAAGWTLKTTESEYHGAYDALIITAPPAQTRDLLEASGFSDFAAEMAEPVRHVQPCWAVAAHFPTPPYQAYDGMRVRSDILSWVANNSSKPGRNDSGQWWVLHATPEWSHAHQETPADDVARSMVREFQVLTATTSEPDDLVPHRWLYAKSSDSATPGFRLFGAEKLGLAGDWLDGGRVEGAFNSANALVKALARAL